MSSKLPDDEILRRGRRGVAATRYQVQRLAQMVDECAEDIIGAFLSNRWPDARQVGLADKWGLLTAAEVDAQVAAFVRWYAARNDESRCTAHPRSEDEWTPITSKTDCAQTAA